jgi:hypothetical protein
MPFFSLMDLHEKLNMASSKIAIAISKSDHHNMRSFRSDIPTTLKGSLELEPLGICTMRNNFGFGLLNKTMTELVQGGILQHFLKYIKEYEFRPIPEEDPGPKVLSVGDLEFGFITWLIACGICVLAFLMEILWWFLKRKFRELVGLYLLLKLLQNRQRLQYQ